VRSLDVDEASDTRSASSEDDSRFSKVLVVNGILVALAAVVAIVVLVTVLTR
jgi:hypothetical protein